MTEARSLHFRPFELRDLESCRTIFLSNVPGYFLPQDEPEFMIFLQNLPSAYFVVEQDREVLACGGWAADADFAILCWGMVSADAQGQGIGTSLLQERVSDARRHGFAKFRIRTSQLTQDFYARHGFRVVQVRRNGFGAGIDFVEMILQI